MGERKTVEKVSIFVPGAPVGKERPRHNTKTGHTYTPKKTREYEAYIALLARRAMRGREPWPKAAELFVRAIFPVPASWSQKKRLEALAGKIRPTVKPDWDNIAKTTDGVNGIILVDDKQVVDAHVSKYYGEKAGVFFEFTWEP